jgi:hypothetical protein
MRIGPEISSYFAQVSISAKPDAVRTGVEPQQPEKAGQAAPADAIQTYDFTNMTPNQMKDAAQKLYDTGQIDLQQLGNLTLGPVVGKVGANGEFALLTQQEREAVNNTPIDYIKLVGHQLSSIERDGRVSDPTSGYGNWKELLSVLKDHQGRVSGFDFLA